MFKKKIVALGFALSFLLVGGVVYADSIQNGDTRIIEMQRQFRNAKPIRNFDDLKPLREVWLYCYAYGASSVRYGADVNTEGWIYWTAPRGDLIWQFDQERFGRWTPRLELRIDPDFGLSNSYRDLLGMYDFTSYRMAAGGVLLSEGVTATPDRFPDDLHSPSVTTRKNDAFAYGRCSLPSK